MIVRAAAAAGADVISHGVHGMTAAVDAIPVRVVIVGNAAVVRVAVVRAGAVIRIQPHIVVHRPRLAIDAPVAAMVVMVAVAVVITAAVVAARIIAAVVARIIAVGAGLDSTRSEEYGGSSESAQQAFHDVGEGAG